VALLDLVLRRDGAAEPVRFRVRRLINAGFTGRDQAAVRRHVEELRAHGVPCPERTPVLYPKPPHLVTTSGEIEVLGECTSGEGEFVLLVEADRVLVGCGSDHTDRDLETLTIEKAKLVCPNVLSPEVWALEDVREGWDALRLRSHVTAGGHRRLYQDGHLAELMTPDDLLALVRGRTVGDLAGSVIFSGTLPLLAGSVVAGERFEVELADERRGRGLRCAYRVTPLAWLRP